MFDTEFISEKIFIGEIPAIVWGTPSDKVYIHVHGKMSRKEHAEEFARIAWEKGWQTVSFDLPRHGERENSPAPCDAINGIRDLQTVADFVYARWKTVSLYACSLGAYFSLNAYSGLPLEKCLFQSPIVDMDYLVEQMMRWFSITPEQLYEAQTIETPIDTMTWDYYRYIKTHPIAPWMVPTFILYGGKDDLQSAHVIGVFAERNHCVLTVSENSTHPFMEEEDRTIVTQWFRETI